MWAYVGRNKVVYFGDETSCLEMLRARGVGTVGVAGDMLAEALNEKEWVLLASRFGADIAEARRRLGVGASVEDMLSALSVLDGRFAFPKAVLVAVSDAIRARAGMNAMFSVYELGAVFVLAGAAGFFFGSGVARKEVREVRVARLIAALAAAVEGGGLAARVTAVRGRVKIVFFADGVRCSPCFVELFGRWFVLSPVVCRVPACSVPVLDRFRRAALTAAQGVFDGCGGNVVPFRRGGVNNGKSEVFSMSPWEIAASGAESAHQKAVFAWAAKAAAYGFDAAFEPRCYADAKFCAERFSVSFDSARLSCLYAIPNGGKRNKATAALLKATGVRAGVPDMHLPVAKGRFHSLYVELKTKNGRLSSVQEDCITRLRREGNQVIIAVGWLEAVRALYNYLTVESYAS